MSTEILKSHRIENVTSSAWTLIIPIADIDVNKTVTILSIIISNQHTAAVDVNLAFHNYNGSSYSNESRFLHTQTIGAKDTFVWSDRLVLYSPSSALRPSVKCLNESGGDTDVYTSYILQDFT